MCHMIHVSQTTLGIKVLIFFIAFLIKLFRFHYKIIPTKKKALLRKTLLASTRSKP